MTDSQDITERLRRLHIMDEVGSDNPLGREAADEIGRLRAENDRLRAENDRLREKVSSYSAGYRGGLNRALVRAKSEATSRGWGEI